MRKIIFGNWKSNKSKNQLKSWFQEFRDSLSGLVFSSIEPVIAPPFVLLDPVEEALKNSGVSLGIQDISAYPAGSYTGAISVHNVNGFAVKYALVGHSERRKYFHEDATSIAQKVTQLLTDKITPIVCVEPETIQETANAISTESLSSCIVAYEPSAAIGSGKNAALQEVKDFKAEVIRLFGHVPYLYGGSVDEKNIAQYLLVTDGVIIGTASLDARQFVSTLKTAQGEKPIGS